MPLYENTHADTLSQKEDDANAEHTYATTAEVIGTIRPSCVGTLSENSTQLPRPESAIYIEPESCPYPHGPEFGVITFRGNINDRPSLGKLRKSSSPPKRILIWLIFLTVLVFLSIGVSIAAVVLWVKRADYKGTSKLDLLKIEEEILSVRRYIEQFEKNDTLEFQKSLELYEWYQAQNGHWYKLFNSRVKYGQAKANCEALGTRLAAKGIRNRRTKNDLLKRLMTADSWHIWIGLDDLQWQSSWIWSDGTPSTVNNTQWKRGEPKNEGGYQRCGHIFVARNWPIDDRECDKTYYYLCETMTPV